MSNNEFGEWSRPQRTVLENRERAYAAAARRRGDRSLKARIESALQASKLHYERTGRCFYITREIVESDSVFDELEDEEQFWDPELLLPERMTSERLREEHYDFLRAAGAIFPPQPNVNGNGLVNGGHLMGTPLLSQTADGQSSNSQSSLVGSQLSGYATSSPLSFHGSQNQTLHGTNLLFPGAVPFNLWRHQPMPTPHINGLGHSEENCMPVLSPGLPDDRMATKAFRKHVRPDAIDDVIGRTSVHLNGWLYDDNTEGPEELLKRSTKFERNMEVRLRNPLLEDSDGYMANQLQEASDLKQAEE